MVIPSALKVLRLKHVRRFCTLGRLGHEVGWKYQDIVAALEAKRKVKIESFYKGKLEVAKAKDACMKDAKVAKAIAPYQKIIESYGHAALKGIGMAEARKSRQARTTRASRSLAIL